MVEILAVLVMIAVLAKIAIPAFTSTSRTAKGASEVSAVFAEIRVREEQYLLENGVYLATGSTDTAVFPTPGTTPQSIASPPAAWTTLKLRMPESALRCGYVVTVGTSATSTVGTVASGTFGFTAPAMNWYYILAQCNLDGSSTKDSYYFTTSLDTNIQKVNEGY